MTDRCLDSVFIKRKDRTFCPDLFTNNILAYKFLRPVCSFTKPNISFGYCLSIIFPKCFYFFVLIIKYTNSMIPTVMKKIPKLNNMVFCRMIVIIKKKGAVILPRHPLLSG